MASHGGPRPNSGRKSKFTDDEGNPIKTKQARIPAILTDRDLEELARQKIREQKQEKSK